jgi:hypothetical protein
MYLCNDTTIGISVWEPPAALADTPKGWPRRTEEEIMRLLTSFAGCWMLVAFAACDHAAAQAPLPAYPLYCLGPLTTGPRTPPPAGPTSTPFKWAAQGAGAANPGPGECTWADRAARGSEIEAGGGNSICDYTEELASLPAGKFLEVGVYRDPDVNNCMHLTHFVGVVNPPFSAEPALPPFVRQSISALSAAQITSLRRGIQVMMSRPASDPTSYHFQANIHGTYDTATNSIEMQAWNQCEHGSFYFFAWHRMYLYFFDRILRAASGDPNLVLPYWNWSDPAQRALPLAFRQPANSSNPLFVASPGRPAALNSGSAQLGAGTVDFSTAFASTSFMSPAGSGLSFGGQQASPEQFNAPHGELESHPHDVVHVALAGLMGDPDTAAEDPIFWLHHANIDRLWKRWLQQGGGRQDPINDAAWMNTTFAFFDEAGHAVHITGSQIIDTVAQLNYRYDDDPAEAPIFHVAADQVGQPTAVPAAPVEPRKLLATSQPAAAAARIQLSGDPVRVSVPLPEPAAEQLTAMIERRVNSKIILQLDDIQYEKPDGIYYEVYVNPTAGEKLDIHNPGYVGTLSFFGLKPHSMPGHTPPAANNPFAEYDISKLVRDLTARGSWNTKEMSVTLVPRGLVGGDGEPLPVPAGVKGTLGSVRLTTAP